MARKPTMVGRYMNEIIDYGGEPYTRAEVIRDMQTSGATQAMINLWFQGYELGLRISERHKTEMTDELAHLRK